MYIPSVLILGFAGSICATSVSDRSPKTNFSSPLIPRQQNANSTCNAYGIDFQNGGSYFINTNSNDSFTCVTKFEGCNNDQANIMLVNEASGDEWECTNVNTVPNDQAMLSTCPVLKNQLTSGQYLILVLGNNGNGNPFAYQREFNLTAGPQQSSTVTPTATLTVTTSSTQVFTSTSTVHYTSTLSSNTTITEPAATNIVTKTPSEVTVTSTKTQSLTFTRWTKTQEIDTVVVAPQCTVPPRSWYPDPPCRWIPKSHPLPSGLRVQARRDAPAIVELVSKRFENMRAAKAREVVGRNAQVEHEAPHQKRDADQLTVTVTASTAYASTVTITGSATTELETKISSDISYFTQPPSTVKAGTKVDTVYARTPTDTVRTMATTAVYATKTWALTWTYTTTTTPAAEASACRSQGGHFGDGFGLP